MLNYIPDWKENKYVLYMAVFVVIVFAMIGSMILFWITHSSITKAKRVVLTIITPLLLLFHGSVFFFITLFSRFDLGTRVVTLTEEVMAEQFMCLRTSACFIFTTVAKSPTK